MSVKLCDILFNEIQHGLTVQDCNFIKALILPPDSLSLEAHGRTKDYLLQIVNNKVCCIDVDKLDYLQRDSLAVSGCPGGLDAQRIIMNTSVKDGILVYPEKDQETVCDIFRIRHSMFSRVYRHKTVIGCEMMYREVIDLCEEVQLKNEAGEWVGLEEASKDPYCFQRLSDWIFHLVRHAGHVRVGNVSKAAAVLQDLDTRRIWKMVGRLKQKKTEGEKARLKARLSKLSGVSEDELVVKDSSFHWGLKEVNPIMAVSWTRKGKDEVFEMREEDAKMMVPVTSSEWNTLLFLKVFDEEKCKAARAAFNLMEKEDGGLCRESKLTPKKRKL